MAHEEMIYGLMESLVIADKHVIGDLMAHKGLWTAGVSAVNNSYKALNLLVDSGKLIKGENFYKLPECKSEYKEHSQLLTKAFAEIIKFNPNCRIFREHTIAEKGLRPDGIVLLSKDGKGVCFILEVMNNESESYAEMKRRVWESFDEATEYLTKLFGTIPPIPYFDIVTSDNLKTYLEGL